MKCKARGLITLIWVWGGVCCMTGCTQSKEQEQKLKQLEELAELNKMEMQNEYEDFARQYHELQTKITNDSLIVQLEHERNRTQALLAELNKTKSNDAAEILRLKKELATLRTILRNYVMQIDSLNRLNQELNNENQNLRNENQQAQQHITSLSAERNALSDKVAIAAQLDANSIRAIAKNKKGKQRNQVKEIKQFQLSFNIARNVTAQSGMKSLYIRILTPTGSVLGQGGTFAYENQQLTYSIRKDIEYAGEDLPVTVYWDVNETLSAGEYRFDIFADGNHIGRTSLSLE